MDNTFTPFVKGLLDKVTVCFKGEEEEEVGKSFYAFDVLSSLIYLHL